jgi:hypothetical protein
MPNPSDYGKPYSTIGGWVATIGLIAFVVLISTAVSLIVFWVKG